MSKRLPDTVLAAKAEAEKFNATFEYDWCKRHHVAIIGINGHKRKVFISRTGSDFRVTNAIQEDVRRRVREMVSLPTVNGKGI